MRCLIFLCRFLMWGAGKAFPLRTTACAPPSGRFSGTPLFSGKANTKTELDRFSREIHPPTEHSFVQEGRFSPGKRPSCASFPIWHTCEPHFLAEWRPCDLQKKEISLYDHLNPNSHINGGIENDEKEGVPKTAGGDAGAVHAPVAHDLGERGHARGKGLALGSLHQRHQRPPGAC